MTEFEIRAVWPEMPETEQWFGYLNCTKGQNWHSNFGPLARQFEEKLCTTYGLPEESVVSASSATAGLSACLIAHNIRGPVLCPAFTFQASACAILGAGCEPVIVDVDPKTAIVGPEALGYVLAKTNAKAALVVAPYGISFDLSEHANVCERAGARLIVDNAAGLGIDRRKFFPRAVSDHVDEVFSLHATKPFGIGEGGAVFTSANNTAAVRSAINFGLTSHSGTGDPKPPFWGINGKMSEVAAAIGLAVAETMEIRVKNRQAMVNEWCNALSGYSDIVFESKVSHSPWQTFPIVLPSESILLAFIENLAAQGIELRRYYFPSLGDCNGMRSITHCKNAHGLSKGAVVLPVRSYMPADQRNALFAATLGALEFAMKETA